MKEKVSRMPFLMLFMYLLTYVPRTTRIMMAEVRVRTAIVLRNRPPERQVVFM